MADKSPRTGDGAAAWASLLAPVRRKGQDIVVLERLAGVIVKVGMKRGQRLPSERELAERLHVGRSTVREALKRWEALGVVERRQGSGAYLLTPIGPDSLHLPLPLELERDALLRVLEVRRALEVAAVDLAARRAGADDVAEIEFRLERLETAHAARGPAPQEDWEFHLATYLAAHNPLFAQHILQVHNAFHGVYADPFGGQSIGDRNFPLHRTLFEAIGAGDPARAVAVASEIIDIDIADVKGATHD